MNHSTLKTFLSLALGALSLVLALSLAIERQHIQERDHLVDNVSTIVLGSMYKVGDLLTNLTMGSPNTDEQLLLLAYDFQVAEDNLRVLRSDSRFPRDHLEALSDQLNTSRIKAKDAVLHHDYQGVESFVPRIEAIARQFPDKIGDDPTAMLIETLKSLRIP